MNQEETIKKILLELEDLRAENKMLKEEIKRLKESKNKDSSNSSKPPSTDSGFKEKSSSKNKNGNKKRGGQKGNKGNNLKKSESPDVIEILAHTHCVNCNHSLEEVKAKSISIKQVFDIPKVEMKVTQIEQHNKICPCCKASNKPNFPKGLNSYVQYGDNIKSFIAYLNTFQMLPYERIGELIEDFTSHKISSGTIYNILEDFYNKLEMFEEKSKEILLKSDIINVDETGTKVGAKLHWSHVISTSVLTYYMIHAKRGGEAIDDMKILPTYKGIAVHDHWKAYLKYKCSHSFCNAHILRELTGVIENENVLWAKDMHNLLTNMNNYLYSIKEKDAPSQGKIKHFYKQYDDICKSAKQYYPPPKEAPKTKRKPKQSKGKNLLDRLVDHKEETLMFFINLLVPFTNNLAERDLRMLKVKEKISGCFASFKGAEIFNRIRGFISTVKKNNLSVLEELHNVLDSKGYMPI